MECGYLEQVKNELPKVPLDADWVKDAIDAAQKEPMLRAQYEVQKEKFVINSKNCKKSIIKAKSQSYRYSKINGLKLLEWLYDHRGRVSGKAVKEAYLYAASLSDKSSVYYKLM